MALSKSKSARDLIHFHCREMKRGQSGDDITLMAAPWGESSTVSQPWNVPEVRGQARSQTKILPIVKLLKTPYFSPIEIGAIYWGGT